MTRKERTGKAVKSNKPKLVAVYLPDALYKAMTAAASAQSRSLSNFVLNLLKETQSIWLTK